MPLAFNQFILLLKYLLIYLCYIVIHLLLCFIQLQIAVFIVKYNHLHYIDKFEVITSITLCQFNTIKIIHLKLE